MARTPVTPLTSSFIAAFPLRRRIAELEDEVRALRSGQEYVPPPPSYSPPPPPPPPPHYGNGYYPGATGMNNPPLGYNPAFYRDYPPETGADPNYINGECCLLRFVRWNMH